MRVQNLKEAALRAVLCDRESALFVLKKEKENSQTSDDTQSKVQFPEMAFVLTPLELGHLGRFFGPIDCRPLSRAGRPAGSHPPSQDLGHCPQ